MDNLPGISIRLTLMKHPTGSKSAKPVLFYRPTGARLVHSRFVHRASHLRVQVAGSFRNRVRDLTKLRLWRTIGKTLWKVTLLRSDGPIRLVVIFTVPVSNFDKRGSSTSCHESSIALSDRLKVVLLEH
jgi:hypothetical protein